MMLKKAIASSGKKLIKAIKNVSRSRLSKKLEQQERERLEIQAQRLNWLKQQRLVQDDLYVQWTLPVDKVNAAKTTIDDSDVIQNLQNLLTISNNDDDVVVAEADCCCCCCCCPCGDSFGCCDGDERDENQRNENLENEMLH